jgi:leucyl aminopeptidase (aminopeptidase T)
MDNIGYLAWRIVQGVGAQPGELIVVQDHAGHDGLLRAICLTLDTAGATPLPEIAPPDHVRQMLLAATPAHMATYDARRAVFMQQADRIIALSGGHLDLAGVSQPAIEAWQAALGRLAEIEEAKRTPNLVVAVPTSPKAQQLGISLEALEAHVLPALTASVLDVQNAILWMRHKLEARRLVVHSGDGHALHVDRGDRLIHTDDGYIDDEDRARGAVVSNLPAGSLYFTVIEDSAEGSLFLPAAGAARDAVLRFERGRVVTIEAASGADALNALFDAHTGEARRISHIGLGLNPFLRQPIGWTLVDEHVYGTAFIAFGENRYMGGQNESSLNEDFAVTGARIEADTVSQ